ncbi:NADH-ubiquinone oxidoreductase chain 6 (mitochondrion) [[Candida] jaroonii]|uniref:NADH-ubiquinone oxidoreductase chain 6 n=1 Tax=[Candida] jaroonii TaxID=467808 RepID=A0ACA9YFZ9_9ASCO|nr:NADH-ubiquinone oxidoreductase chain 6 [[Candida] jaroonii]
MNLISGLSSMLAMGLLSPVQSMLCLMMLFVSTAMCLYNQGFMLMGMLYVTMYVGAMAMLFLFMLSLLKMEYMEQGSMSPLMLTMLMVCLLPLDMFNMYETDNMMEEVSTVWNELTIVGNQFYTEYAVLLMMVGLILMLSVMGAMSMTR